MNRLTANLLGLTATVVFFAACAANPAADKPQALVADAAPVAAAENRGATESLAITPVNSKVEFTGSKVTGSESGSFQDFVGAIELVDEQPEKSRVSVEIKTASVVTDAGGLDEHLKTADFFDVEKYPKAVFVSTAVKKLENNEKATHELTGNFELHGVRKTISFPANIKIDEKSAQVTSEFAINRKDFGIAYAGRTNDLIRDEVVIKLTINAPRAKSALK